MLNINHGLHVIAYFCIVHINNTNYPEKKTRASFFGAQSFHTHSSYLNLFQYIKLLHLF